MVNRKIIINKIPYLLIIQTKNMQIFRFYFGNKFIFSFFSDKERCLSSHGYLLKMFQLFPMFIYPRCRCIRDWDRKRHCSYIRWQVRNRCARVEINQQIYQLQAFLQVDSSCKFDFFSKSLVFLHKCATCSESPSNVSTMVKRFIHK